MERIESVQLGDRTFAALRRAIVSGELAPAAPLLDRRLAEELGVSRTPVREALHRLKEAGLVDYSRAGWAVRAFTERDVHELFQLRLLLEPVGLEELSRRPAADPGVEEQVGQITGAFDGFTTPIARERYEEYFAHDDAFHRAIVAGSGNERLVGFYGVLNAQINRGRYFLIGTTAGRVEQTLDEHEQIIRAVREGDFDAARDALVRHLRTGEDLMVRALRAQAKETR